MDRGHTKTVDNSGRSSGADGQLVNLQCGQHLLGAVKTVEL